MFTVVWPQRLCCIALKIGVAKQYNKQHNYAYKHKHATCIGVCWSLQILPDLQSLEMFTKFNEKSHYCSRLAIQDLQTSNIFEGPEDSRYFSHDVELLQKKHYFLAGQLVALSLAHDGPTLSVLNQDLFDFMVGRDTLTFDCTHILPVDIQTIINEVSFCFEKFFRYRYCY